MISYESRYKPKSFSSLIFFCSRHVYLASLSLLANYSIAQPDEYEKLGSYAMIGLPDVYKTRYGEFRRCNVRMCLRDGQLRAAANVELTIVVAGYATVEVRLYF